MTIAFAALASAPVGASAKLHHPGPACAAVEPDAAGVRRAFFFAYPLYEMNRMRRRMLSAPGAHSNMLLHRSTLSRPSDRAITMPNNDTLYSTAWLDLADGPARFTIPAMGPRYHSVELMHAFSDAFAMLRNNRDASRSYWIVGPGWHGKTPAGATLVRSPTRDAWLVIRTFVDGADDLAEAQRLQRAFTLEPAAEPKGSAQKAERLPSEPDAATFLDIVDAALARGPFPPVIESRIACFAPVGVAPREAGAVHTLAPATRQLWDDALPLLYGEARRALTAAGTAKNGWRYPARHIGDFGTDDEYRTAMAMGGLAAMPIEEAMNPLTATDADGKPLNGASRYLLTIPGNVPVDGFWSLTLYQSDGVGRWYLYDNPIDRYAVSSATTSLRRGKMRQITLDISHESPADPANWLPAPEGDFLLVFRAYRPRRTFVSGAFPLPPIARVGP